MLSNFEVSPFWGYCGEKRYFWIVSIYPHEYPYDYDVRQTVILSRYFYGYENRYLKFQNRDKQFELYNSYGDYFGESHEGRFFIINKEKTNTSYAHWFGLYDSQTHEEIIPTNFSEIDYAKDKDNVFAIVTINYGFYQTLKGVFCNNRLIIPIDEYFKIIKHFSDKFFIVQKEENGEKQLFGSDGKFITNYKYALTGFEYFDSWQERKVSSVVFKLYDEEDDEFKLIINKKLISNDKFISLSWVNYSWQSDDFDVLLCKKSNGFEGLLDIESSEWLIEPNKFKKIEYDRYAGIIKADDCTISDSSFNQKKDRE